MMTELLLLLLFFQLFALSLKRRNKTKLICVTLMEIYYKQPSWPEDMHNISFTFSLSFSRSRDIIVFREIQVIFESCTLLKAKQMNY